MTARRKTVVEMLLPAARRRPDRRWLVRELLWVLGITLIVHVLEFMGVFWRLEAVGLDVVESLGKQRTSEEIVIVQITEAEFKELFSGQRPLKAEVVQTFVDEIAKAKPRIIAIDLDLIAPNFREPDCSIPIIWARDVRVKTPEEQLASHASHSSPL